MFSITHHPACYCETTNLFLRECILFVEKISQIYVIISYILYVTQSHRQRRAVPAEASAKIKSESSSLEASQAPCKDTAVDRRLDSENSETIELLSLVLHANPHVSIRDSLKSGEDIPLTPTGFKHLFCLHSPAVFAPN